MAEYEMPPYHLDDDGNQRQPTATATRQQAPAGKKKMDPREEIATVCRSIMLSSNVEAGDRLEAARLYGNIHGIDLNNHEENVGKSVLTED